MIDFKQLNGFVDTVHGKLDLLCPVELRFKFIDNEETDAEYIPKFNKRGDIKRHIITFYVCPQWQFERSFQTLIAHELIHAWQAENNCGEIHGEKFQYWARILEQDFGIMLDRVYDPELDTP